MVPIPASKIDYNLSKDSVDLWWSWVNAIPLETHDINRLLSKDELERAARFAFDRDRTRFVASRIMLRHILAGYSGQLPENIEFQYGFFGKPQLRQIGTGRSLEFNISHSNELIFCAVAHGRQIGVDVEFLQPIENLEEFVLKVLSKDEQISLSALESQQRLIGFYNCWTRKEAYVKARGDGLNMPLHSFSVSLNPEDHPSLPGHYLNPQELGRWSFHAVSPSDHYVGALAVQGDDAQLSMRKWNFSR